MKYITSVICGNKDIKYIIELNGKNVEVLRPDIVEKYYNKKGEHYFLYNWIAVYDDLTVKIGKGETVHLAEIVLAIELARFIMEQT